MSADDKIPVSGAGRKFPPAFYNTITLAGGFLAALCLGLIILLVCWEYFAHESSPYMGVIAFVVLPSFMILGLLVGAFGIARQLRRRHLGLPSTEQLPRIDLNNPAHLRATIMISAGFVFFLVASGFGSFKAYEYTDNNEFCGKMCHAVMKPEYTAFQVSPHARVGCVKCHIGPGAEWFVRAKLSGAYQVYSVLFNKYSRPIPTPVHNLRPSRDTCEQCHWPAHFMGEKLVSHDYFAADDANTHRSLKLLMKTGGGGGGLQPAHGIHWHVAEDVKVSYIATDERRLEIPWVKYTDASGVEKIFRSTESDPGDSVLTAHEERTMDCIDCHNRPTHHYNPPARLINEAMANGLISRELPGIKGVLRDLMSASYATEDEALAAIDKGVVAYYQENDPEIATSMAKQITASVVAAQDLFRHNIFPEMKVDWRGFPDHIGHLTTPGCFRCHDGLHETAAGEVISQDCNLCHEFTSQAPALDAELGPVVDHEFRHPEDIDQEWKTTACSECHGE